MAKSTVVLCVFNPYPAGKILPVKCAICYNFQSASKSFKVGKIIVWVSNTLDPDETRSYSASHLDLGCLHKYDMICILRVNNYYSNIQNSADPDQRAPKNHQHTTFCINRSLVLKGLSLLWSAFSFVISSKCSNNPFMTAPGLNAFMWFLICRQAHKKKHFCLWSVYMSM